VTKPGFTLAARFQVKQKVLEQLVLLFKDCLPPGWQRTVGLIRHAQHLCRHRKYAGMAAKGCERVM
jgi:hypothetical protein